MGFWAVKIDQLKGKLQSEMSQQLSTLTFYQYFMHYVLCLQGYLLKVCNAIRCSFILNFCILEFVNDSASTHVLKVNRIEHICLWSLRTKVNVSKQTSQWYCILVTEIYFCSVSMDNMEFQCVFKYWSTTEFEIVLNALN